MPGPARALRLARAGRSARDPDCSDDPLRGPHREGERNENADLRVQEMERVREDADDVIQLVVEPQMASDDAIAPPGCFAANAWLRTATLLWPGFPSSSRNSRPVAASVRRTWKNDGVTFIADTPSAVAPHRRGSRQTDRARPLRTHSSWPAVEVVWHRRARALDASAGKESTNRSGGRVPDMGAAGTGPIGRP